MSCQFLREAKLYNNAPLLISPPPQNSMAILSTIKVVCHTLTFMVVNVENMSRNSALMMWAVQVVNFQWMSSAPFMLDGNKVQITKLLLKSLGDLGSDKNPFYYRPIEFGTPRDLMRRSPLKNGPHCMSGVSHRVGKHEFCSIFCLICLMLTVSSSKSG